MRTEKPEYKKIMSEAFFKNKFNEINNFYFL